MAILEYTYDEKMMMATSDDGYEQASDRFAASCRKKLVRIVKIKEEYASQKRERVEAREQKDRC